MRCLSGVLALALASITWAGSPHAYHRDERTNKRPVFKVTGQSLSVRGISSNGSLHLNELFGRQGTDTPTPDDQDKRTPPLFPLPGCMWCPPAKNDPAEFAKSFTIDRFMSTCRALKVDLIDTCIFYTSSTPKLSAKANEIACLYQKYSIWNLWPNKNTATADNRYFDFYGVYDVNNPLNVLTTLPDDNGVPVTIKYFQAMSQAMARLCTGNTYVFSDNPFNLGIYNNPSKPNIWYEIEYKELLLHRGDLKKWIVIDARGYTSGTKPPAYIIDDPLALHTDQNSRFTNYRREDNDTETLPPGYRHYDLDLELAGVSLEQIAKRAASCSDSGIGSEPANMDFFG